MILPHRLRATFALASALAACVGACAGKSGDPPPSNGNGALSCLTELTSYCCSDAAPQTCIGDFGGASRCATWPSGTQVHVYTTPCHAMTAVRVDATWSTFYVFGSTGALVAIADNAANAQDPRDTTIECGAGPKGFTIPSDCGTGWLSSAGAAACAGGSAAPAAYCGTH